MAVNEIDMNPFHGESPLKHFIKFTEHLQIQKSHEHVPCRIKK